MKPNCFYHFVFYAYYKTWENFISALESSFENEVNSYKCGKICVLSWHLSSKKSDFLWWKLKSTGKF